MKRHRDGEKGIEKSVSSSSIDEQKSEHTTKQKSEHTTTELPKESTTSSASAIFRPPSPRTKKSQSIVSQLSVKAGVSEADTAKLLEALGLKQTIDLAAAKGWNLDDIQLENLKAALVATPVFCIA